MAAGNIGGGGAAVGSPISGGTANRILYNDSSGNLADSSLMQFNGTEMGVGDAAAAGYRLRVRAAASDAIGRFEAAATGTNTGSVAIGTSGLANFAQIAVNGAGPAGTDAGLTNNSISKYNVNNSTAWLIGPTDVRTWVRRGANLAAAIGGTIKTFVADASHDGTGTDVFYTYSIPAASMITDQDRIEFEYTATFAANANNKTVIVAYGATEVYNSGAVAKNGGSLRVFGTIWRVSATTQRWVVTAADDASTVRFPVVSGYGTAAETLSGAVAIEFRGTATAAADIVAKVGAVATFPAGNA